MTLTDVSLRFEGVQNAAGEERRSTTNSPRKNEASGPKQKRLSVVKRQILKVTYFSRFMECRQVHLSKMVK